jgi:hypothetical protein
MSATTFVVVLVIGIFVFDFVHRWWRETEWKRRWRDKDEDR